MDYSRTSGFLFLVTRQLREKGKQNINRKTASA